MTILFVTHDIDESVYLADRVVVLSKPPTFVVTTLDIPLSGNRDQIETKEDPNSSVCAERSPVSFVIPRTTRSPVQWPTSPKGPSITNHCTISRRKRAHHIRNSSYQEDLARYRGGFSAGSQPRRLLGRKRRSAR